VIGAGTRRGELPESQVAMTLPTTGWSSVDSAVVVPGMSDLSWARMSPPIGVRVSMVAAPLTSLIHRVSWHQAPDAEEGALTCDNQLVES
jgi:hypothetical protein